MKNKIITTLSILAFVGGFLIFYQNRPAVQKTPATPETSQQANNSQKWETKTDEQANVTVVVTPLDLSLQSTQWRFDVGMNTHSVELDQDMVKIATLIDDQGNEYGPLNWEGAGPGGHHREGVLTFNMITPTPKSIKLKISGIGDVTRSFVWEPK